MQLKEIRLLKNDGSLALQENTALFKLSVILESFVESHDDSSDITDFAKRLDDFIWNDNLTYIEY